MNERPLPDDPAHWPSNPYDLLGVARGVTPRELRRAYNRLIRVYKPEQFPEQFRRIREAYESLIPMAEWFAAFAQASDPPPENEAQPKTNEQTPDDGASTWVSPTPQPLDETPEPDFPAARPRRTEDDPDTLWELAVMGRAPAAYERLEQLTQQHAGRTELYLRLYWLLTLWPELDSRRVPADWLVQGLLATGMSGPLRELYQEELADDPAEALAVRFDRLLDAPISSGALADLIEWRFRAVARLKRWDILAEDVARLRPRFGPDEERLWLRLLFFLADQLGLEAMADPAGVHLIADCRTEIDRHKHLALSLSHSFDRFDLLLQAWAGWIELRVRGHVPDPMVRLLGASWSRPLAGVREPLREVLKSIAGAPRQWLDHLDEMDWRAPATLAVFGELLDQFEAAVENAPAPPHDPEVLNRLVLGFLPRLNANEYTEMRPRLLAFCLREAVAPEDMAEVASRFVGGWEDLGSIWARYLKGDWPLRYLCRAYRLFWA